jgi:hypothetical protein
MTTLGGLDGMMDSSEAQKNFPRTALRLRGDDEEVPSDRARASVVFVARLRVRKALF